MIKIPFYCETNVTKLKGEDSNFSDYVVRDGYVSKIIEILPVYDDETFETHSEIVTNNGTYYSPLAPEKVFALLFMNYN